MTPLTNHVIILILHTFVIKPVMSYLKNESENFSREVLSGSVAKQPRNGLINDLEPAIFVNTSEIIDLFHVLTDL